jgi:hypothetical protein
MRHQVGRKLRKTAAIVVALGTATGVNLSQVALAQNTIGVTLNGQPINFGGVPPTQVGGRVLVPLRGVFEALGAQVDYDAASGTVFAARGTTQVQLRIGSTQATVNGQTRVLDVPAQTRLGRTLVPLRFVSEAMGAQVNWDPGARLVSITGTTDVSDVNGPFGPGPRPTPTPLPDPIYAPPVSSGRAITGTVVKVDPTLPANITLRVGTGFRTFVIDANTQVTRQATGVVQAGATPVFGPAVALNSVAQLIPGEEVQVRTDNQGQVIEINSQLSLVTARVRSAQGNQIVLEDARGTTLTVGPNLRFIDARGRAVSTATLQPGQSIALFIAPSTRRIYQVSALRGDVDSASNPLTYTAPGDNTFPGDDNTFPGDNTGINQPPAGTPQITLVQHNVTRPLRSGATVAVTVRGTPGMTGTFTVTPSSTELPLNEDLNRPGVYTGNYSVRAGENAFNTYVTAYLRSANGQEALLQSRTPLTIDNIAPRITSTSPLNNSTVNSAQPNIVLYANDIGGSGLASATITINGQRVDAQQITVSPNNVSFIPDQPLQGTNVVRATVYDAAGNATTTAFTFTTDENAANGLITSLTHNGTRALQGGDRVTVFMAAQPGGRASFDVLGDNNRIVARNIALTEEATPGRYRGTYTIQQNVTDANLTIRGRFTDLNGDVATLDATSSVQLLGGGQNAANSVTISTPLENDTVASPLTVRGTAVPGATVEVSVRAEGVRYYIFDYKEELGTQQVQANTVGNWTTQAFTLPRPRNVSGLKYVVTAVQIDAAGQRSEPVITTVTAR